MIAARLPFDDSPYDTEYPFRRIIMQTNQFIIRPCK
jgi:hypothetical protein